MPIFAREAELYKLKSALAECLSGRPNVTVLEGPTGCGKTALLETLMEQAAAEGAVVLRAAALRSERDWPLSVMRQLTDNRSASDDIERCLAALSADDPGAGAPAAALPGWADEGGISRACADLCNIARERPILIGVDDAHHADDRSLRRLLYLAARARTTGLMMVFTEALHYRQWRTAYRDVFPQQPDYQRIELTGLEPDGVVSLASEHARTVFDDLQMDGLHAATGGNPLLIRALLEDHLTATAMADPSERVEVLAGGEMFAQAVLTCVDRSGPVAAQVAEGLAVLGEDATPDILRRLCRLTLAVTELGTRVLWATGVTENFGFRHPTARAAVLDGMAPSRRRELHSRAAALLDVDGASAVTVAAHLRNAECVEEPWGVPVLQEAAEEALAEDRDASALDYLDLAYRFCLDARQRVEIRLRSAVILQRSNPWAAERLGDELLASLRAGELTAKHCALLANVLAGQGRIQEAKEAFGTLRRLDDGDTPVPGDWAAGPRALLGERHHPWVCTDVCERSGDDGSPCAGSATAAGTMTGCNVLPWGGPVPAAGDGITVAAEELLQRCVVSDSTLEAISSAIKCLTYAGRAERAQHWSGLFLKEADRRSASGWSAHFAALQAESAYHQGNVRQARDLAGLGLERISGRNRSLLACWLLAAQIMSETAMGDYEAGARMLHQPTPESLLGSIHGLTYVRARGRYYLATDRLDDALDDFMSVGQTARRWGTDVPAWLPWRGDAAEVLLRFGQRKEAERLIVEQQARTADNCGRAQGMTLRLLAATAPPDRRPPVLARSMALLHSAGDRLELARTLYDLADVYRRLGETARAAMASRRACQLTRECGAEPLCSGDHLGHGEEHRTSGAGNTVVGVSSVRLSSSERRVAVLAACGYTNRDISSRLSVTISTVEQHLTGVYRKFRICGREQLPLELQFEVEDIA